MFTPLYSGDDMLRDLAGALSQDTFDLFFFSMSMIENSWARVLQYAMFYGFDQRWPRLGFRR